jgi:hypothetical protein
VGVVLDEHDCPAQRPGLRGRRFGIVPHWPVGIPTTTEIPNALAAGRCPDTICP